MILIAGAGISGLSLAFFLRQQGKEFLLLDPADSAGGKIRTLKKNGFLLDTGPNTLLADEEVMHFLEAAGLSPEIEFPEALSSKRFIYRNGRFHGLSGHPLSLFLSPLLSWKGKLRILRERWISPSPDAGESLAAFVTRRFGAEALDWLASPVQYGIHAADPEKLLVADAFPALWKMEQEFGSVLKGLGASGKAKRARTLNFKGGMQTLPDTLARIAGDKLRLNTGLIRVEKSKTGWNCLLSTAEGNRWQEAESIVFCMPAPQASGILAASGLTASAELAAVKYNPMAMAHMVFRQKSEAEFPGFGGLVPASAGFKTAGAIWTSSIFSNRQPKGYLLLTAFYGGALRTEVSSKTEEDIEAILQEENVKLYGRKADSFANIEIWKEGIPQYDAERRKAEKAVNGLEAEKLWFLANWKGGIGLSDCIRNAAVLAGKLG